MKSKSTRVLSAVSKVERIKMQLKQLSQTELRQVRVWLDDVIEDDFEFTSEFESGIQRSEREMQQGKRPRTRQP